MKGTYRILFVAVCTQLVFGCASNGTEQLSDVSACRAYLIVGEEVGSAPVPTPTQSVIPASMPAVTPTVKKEIVTDSEATLQYQIYKPGE